MSGGGGGSILGYKYFFTILMGISRGPVDELTEIKVGDKVAWRGEVTDSTQININAPGLFGGEQKEGGVEGTLDVMMGKPDQTAPAKLLTMAKATSRPGYRRVFMLLFDGMITAMNPYPKPWKVRCSRRTKGWENDAPWKPELATIAVTREVSEGEVVGGTTTGGTTRVYTEIEGRIDGSGVATLDEPPDIVARHGVYAYRNRGGDGDESRTAIEGVDFTRVGNVYTFTNPEFFGLMLSASMEYMQPHFPPTPSGLGRVLINAMNPAHIIYESMTNREWGRGLPSSSIDEANFEQVARKLLAEGFGLCLKWSRNDNIMTFVNAILDHIGANLYQSRTTALWTLKLIRGDYVQDDLPLLTYGEGLVSIVDGGSTSGTPKASEVKVTYRDPVTDEDRTVSVRNLALIQANRGAVNSVSTTYTGIPIAALAMRVAQRDLKAKSTDIRRYNLVLDRRAWKYVTGDVIRVRALDRNMSDVVLRLGTMDYGTLQNGEIKCTAVEDVFATPRQAFSTMEPPPWVPPTSRPCLGRHRVFEASYRDVYRANSAAELAAIGESAGYIAAVAEQGQPMNASFSLGVRKSAPTPDDEPTSTDYFCGYVP